MTVQWDRFRYYCPKCFNALTSEVKSLVRVDYSDKWKEIQGQTMKVRITYRNEVFIEGKDLKEIARKFDSMSLVPENASFVEVSSVEDGKTLEDLKRAFEDAFLK